MEKLIYQNHLRPRHQFINFGEITDWIINWPFFSYNELLLKKSLSNSNLGTIIPYLQQIKDKNNHQNYNEVLFRYKSNITNETHWPNMLDWISPITLNKVLIKLISDTFNLKDWKKYSFNFTKNNILSEEILDFLQKSVLSWKIKPDNFVVEILEEVVNSKKIKQKLSDFKQLWFSIAMDDFWTSHSNYKNFINYNKDNLLDIIKIDRNYFNNNKNNHNFKQLLSLFKSKGLKIVIEWIETKNDYNLSLSLWTDYTQGFFHWKPKPIKTS